jgi:phospholipase C
VRNSGKQVGRVTITSNAYDKHGPWTMDIKPGDIETQHWNLQTSGDWYDFTVSSENFERRFAGRVESGRPGVSDPAMALHLQG